MNDPKYQIAIRCPSCNRQGAAMANARHCPKCQCQFQAIAAGEQPTAPGKLENLLLEQFGTTDPAKIREALTHDDEEAGMVGFKLGELQDAIRHVRDQRGDDRCWMSWEAVYALLPEGYTPPVRDETVELEACRHFIRSIHDPKVSYCSQQRRIEELEAEVAEWRKTGAADVKQQMEHDAEDAPLIASLLRENQALRKTQAVGHEWVRLRDELTRLNTEIQRYQQLAAEADKAKGGLTILIELTSHGGGRGTLRVTGPTPGC